MVHHHLCTSVFFLLKEPLRLIKLLLFFSQNKKKLLQFFSFTKIAYIFYLIWIWTIHHSKLVTTLVCKVLRLAPIFTKKKFCWNFLKTVYSPLNLRFGPAYIDCRFYQISFGFVGSFFSCWGVPCYYKTIVERKWRKRDNSYLRHSRAWRSWKEFCYARNQ